MPSSISEWRHSGSHLGLGTKQPKTLGLVSVLFENHTPVKSRFYLALIFRYSLGLGLALKFQVETCLGVISLVRTWSLHTNSLNLPPKLPYFNLIYLNVPHFISIYPIYLNLLGLVYKTT